MPTWVLETLTLGLSPPVTEEFGKRLLKLCHEHSLPEGSTKVQVAVLQFSALATNRADSPSVWYSSVGFLVISRKVL